MTNEEKVEMLKLLIDELEVVVTGLYGAEESISSNNVTIIPEIRDVDGYLIYKEKITISTELYSKL